MEQLDDSRSFVKHVFNFNDESKAEMLNIVQYALLAIVPVVLLNKTMQRFVPEGDDKKSSLEISAEVIIQLIVMFLGLLFIHRIVTFVPTYSATAYPEFHIVYIVLAVMMVTMSLQTKLGEKVSILSDRVFEAWNGNSTGNSNDKKQAQKSSNTSGSVSGGGLGLGGGMGGINHGMGGSDGTAISMLPTSSASPNPNATMPNFDAMYKQNPTPLVMESMEPMAANSMLGSGAFGSW